MTASSEIQAVVAADLGTSALKVGLVALDGRPLGQARVPLTLLLDGEPGRAEQDAERWWSAMAEGTAAAQGGAAAFGRVRPIAVCCVGHGPTLVPTGADGRSIGPAVTWLDRRAATDVDEAARRLGRVGWTVSLLGTARRLARVEPDRYATAAWFLSSWDHLACRLSGTAVAALQDPADAISAAEARAAGLDGRAAPAAARSGTAIGPLTPGAARHLGLPAGIPVVAGANDAIATFLGAGLTAAGQAIDTGGTSGGFGLYVDRPVSVPGLWTGSAPLPGLHYVGGAMAGTGKALDWLARGALGGAAPVATLLAEAEATPPGADGLVFLPYLAGERWPLHDPAARGAFVGLTLRHGRGHLVRAVLEAAAYALRHVAAPAVAAGLPFVELRSTGGPAASPAWCQIKADVAGLPVVVPTVADASLMGAAVLAAVGAGAFPEARAAMAAMVRLGQRFEPRPARREVHDRTYAVYEELGRSLVAANAALGELDTHGAD